MISYPLHVHESGHGSPEMVLLHGLGGSWRYWQGTLPTIERHRRALCPDLLGFGRSPWPAIDYTPHAHVEALRNSLEPRLSGPVDLVGHSLGAVLALELAASMPSAVRSLTLLALPCYRDEAEAGRFVRRQAWGRLMLDHPQLARLTCTLICQRRRIWRPILPSLLPKLPRAVVEDAMLHRYDTVASTLEHCVIHHRINDAARRLLETGRRIRLVVGATDPMAPPELAQAFAERHRGTEVTVVHGREHHFPLHDVSYNAELLSCGCGPRCPMFLQADTAPET